MHNKSLTMIFTAIIIAAMLLPGVSAASVQAAPAAPVAVDVPTAAGDTCQVLQPGPAACLTPTSSRRSRRAPGHDTELRVKTETGKLKRALLQFDLSCLPAGATVSSATLSLWVKEVRDGGATINAHQVTSSWNEAEVTWKARDKAANLLWTSLGGDYDATVLSSTLWSRMPRTTGHVEHDGRGRGWAANPPPTTASSWSPRSPTRRTRTSSRAATTARPASGPSWKSATRARRCGRAITPDNTGQGVAGHTRTYAHTVRRHLPPAVNLSAVSSKGWTTRIYQDTNGNGQGRRRAADHQLATLGPNASCKILVQVDIPASTATSTVDNTTVTATAVANGTSDTARDTTRVGPLISVAPNGGSYATAGRGSSTATPSSTTASADLIISADLQPGLDGVAVEDDRNGTAYTTTPLANPVCLDPGESLPSWSRCACPRRDGRHGRSHRRPGDLEQ